MSELMVKKPWFTALQTKALQEFDRLGFPDRHHEDWKYTALPTLLQHSFHLPAEDAMGQAENLPLDGYQIKIINGKIQIPDNLPRGLIVKSLFDAIEDHPQLVKTYFAQSEQINGFQALNTARLTTGLFIHLEKGVQLSKPIILQHRQTIAEQVVHLRHLIIAEEGSSASLMDVYEGENCYFTNAVSELFLAPQANFVYYKILSESKAAFHISHLEVRQKKLSQFKAHSISTGGGLVHSDLSIFLEEEGADCLLNGLYLPCGKQQHDHHTKVVHLVPHCSSFQDYKGILQEEARVFFKGKVVVAKDAQKTEAHQYNKNLLLSLKAEVYTQPQLEIFADDVICTHGATVGQLSEEALFYLATRGLNREEASYYLIQAFVRENLNQVLEQQVAAWMTGLMNKQLGVSDD